MVAFWRGLNTLGVTNVRGFSDPYAARLLPPLPSLALRGMGWLFERKPELRERLLAGSRGMLDVVALRTRAIDETWDEAAGCGVRQLVLLGAGLDARAWRLPSLEGVRAFEVDHPWTQALKRKRARGLSSPAAEHVYVPVDFARDDLAGKLSAAGLRVSERSHWIWEGVTHYLPHEATARTLHAIAALAPTGSRLVVTYGEPRRAADASVDRRRQRMLRRAGEEQIGLLERGQMAHHLERAGWRVRLDQGIDDLARRFSDGPADLERNIPERVVLAERS